MKWCNLCHNRLRMPEEPPEAAEHRHDNGHRSWLSRVVDAVKGKPDSSLRETLEEYIEEEPEDSAPDSVSAHEKALLANILKLRDLKVVDVMVPRADIVAIDVGTSQKELLELLAEKQHSRLPVYKETLDHVLGTIHIKDILATLAKGGDINIKNLVRDIPVISPAMHVLDLLLQMRESKKHMALVVDEFGGTDGLIAIGDVIESIVGEIDDEYEPDDTPQLTENTDGSILADARVDIDEFEEKYGRIFSREEREESDTLGGLVFFLAGRIPTRGEVLKHRNGMEFEIVDAGPRHINRICIRNIPVS